MQIGWSRVGVNIHVGQCTTPVCAPTRTAALSLELRPVVAADGARAGDDGAVASRGGIAAAPRGLRPPRRRERDLPDSPRRAETPSRRDELALPSAPSRHEEEENAVE